MTVDVLADDACGALSEQEISDLRRAVRLLEGEHIVAKLANLVGKPIENVIGALPDNIRQEIDQVVKIALKFAYDAAAKSVPNSERPVGWSWLDRALTSEWLNSVTAAINGIWGGIGGVPTALLEVTPTAVLFMRMICVIARSEGENLDDEETRMACLQVFALGGTSSSDDAAEVGYFAVRLALAEIIGNAGGKSLESILPKIIARVAQGFGIPVTAKIGVEAVPGIGAATGAIVNVAFMDHFQDRARGHFIVRRLIRQHGENQIKSCYEKLRSDWERRQQ